MIIKGIVLLTLTAVVLAKPAARPISVYQQQQQQQQQDEGEDRQEYQQPQQYQTQQYQPQQYRPAPAQYKPQPLQQQKARPAFKQPGQQLIGPDGQPLSEDYEMEPPQPYQFSFDVNDDENTNYQNRKEQREGNKISGSYSVVDSDGFIRTVTYTADPVEGFKATVSREPTDIVVKLRDPKPQEDQSLRPKNQYQQPAKQPQQIQYTGAPAPRPVQLRPQPSFSNLRKQQTQQYLQSPDPYSGQGSVRVSQAISQGGQINQFLSESSPETAHQLSQFSNSNSAVSG